MAYQGNVPAEAYTTTAKDTFNGNGSTTAFTLSLPTVTNDIRVVVENVVQEPTAAYSVSGTTLTFTAAPPSGTGNVYVVHLGPAVQTVEPPSTIAGATTFASTVSAQSNLLFPDNSKAIFGAGSDLQIYHDNSVSWVKNTGDLVLQGNGVRLFNNSVDVVADFGSSGAGSAAARLFFAGNGEKLATTATGVTVTGDITPTGGVYLGGTVAANYLDDYEEGTFTYSLPCSVSGGYYPRAGYATGYYTKVGRIVSITLRYESQGSSSPSGQLQLSNLPFVFISTIASGSPAFGWPILIRGANNNGDFASAFFNAQPATSYGGFYKQLANGTYAVLSNNDVASNFEGQMCFSYVTS